MLALPQDKTRWPICWTTPRAAASSSYPRAIADRPWPGLAVLTGIQTGTSWSRSGPTSQDPGARDLGLRRGIRRLLATSACPRCHPRVEYLKRTATVDPATSADEIEVVDYDEHRRIVDPLLSRCIEKAGDQRRHIVGDLERLSVKVGPDELHQIKNYAPAIAKGLRFDLQRTRWEFWVVSTEIRGTADEGRRR